MLFSLTVFQPYGGIEDGVLRSGVRIYIIISDTLELQISESRESC